MPSVPRISVLLPVLNADRTLAACLRSLGSQTHAELEILAVDDHSTDESPRLLADFVRTDKRLKVLSSAGSGIVAALETGLRAASGEFIARMDADDVCHPARLSWQLDMALGLKLDLVSCRVSHFGSFADGAGYASYVAWTNRFLDHHELSLAAFRESPFAHPSMLFPRRSLERFGGYRQGPFPEDYEMWLRWFSLGARAGKHPATLLAWRDHPGRLSRLDARYEPMAFAKTKVPALFAHSRRFNRDHPRLTILGAGRLARKKMRLLVQGGFEPASVHDIDPAKIGREVLGLRVLDRKDLGPPGGPLCVSLVSGRGADELVEAFLLAKGYKPGQDYLLAG